MCNFYHKKRTKGKCFYPEIYLKAKEYLPIDDNGFCIFHSNQNEFKKDYNFIEEFFKLISIINTQNHNTKLKPEYNFSGFIFPDDSPITFDSTEFINELDLSYCTFNSSVTFKNIVFRTVDLQNVKSKKRILFDNCEFKENIYGNKSSFKDGLRFQKCKLPKYITFEKCKFENKEKRASCELSFKYCDKINHLSLDNSVINCRFIVDNTNTDATLSFNECKFYDEFIFKQVEINSTISFHKTQFLLENNINPLYTTVSFFLINLNREAKIQFIGEIPYEDQIKGELSINFKEKPKEGLIYFKNFNLNKVYQEDKAELFSLEKNKVVEIGLGCRKYYVQTENFFIKTKESNQNLITEIINVFSNYFKINESFNLGIEIVEKKPNEIIYFYFTDEMISLEKFLSRIKQNESTLWDTLSNLTEIARNTLPTNNINLIDCLIQLESWWKMLGLRVVKNQLNILELTNIINSVSIDKKSEIEVSNTFKQINNNFNKALKQGPVLISNHGNMEINFNKKVEKVNINDFSKSITIKNNLTKEQHKKLIKIIEEVEKEPLEKKESKLKELAQEWLPTISGMISEALKPYFGL